MNIALYTNIAADTKEGRLLAKWMVDHFDEWIQRVDRLKLCVPWRPGGHLTTEEYAIWAAASALWGYGMDGWKADGIAAREFFAAQMAEWQNALRLRRPGTPPPGQFRRGNPYTSYRLREGHPEPFFFFDQWLDSGWTELFGS